MLATLDSQVSVLAITENNAQNLPLQPHINGNLNGMVTPGNDPFNPKPRMVSNSVYSDVTVMPEPNGLEWETPITNGAQLEDDVVMDDAPFSDDAPAAPARRTRNLYTFQQESASDIPKMSSITTRSKTKVGPDHGDTSEHIIRPTSIPVSHKRTISGQMTNAPSSASSEPPGAPQRRSDRLLRNKLLPASSRLATAMSRDPESRERRELRKARAATGAKGKSISTVGRVVSGNRKPLDPSERDTKEGRAPSVASNASTIREPLRRAMPPPPDVSPQKEALVFLIDQYSKLGQGYLALNRYECPVALGIFDLLAPQFRETPWVLAQIGRSHFEKSAYLEAEQIFAKIRKIAPSRPEDMEIYSTVLWHLKKDVDLAYLSHELIEMDRLSPQAWCALGNAFSLQGEHDQAVKCFKRATQLDPKFAYAFTLAGHEHVANEEFEKALFAFRSAISADNRHYNGWYGLGRVFEKLGKYEIARDHYVNAAKINSTNPVLKVCIGLVLEKTCVGLFPEKQRRRELALEMYHEACEQDPRSAKARFAKARVLLVLHRPKEAFYELDALKNMMPDDADVHFLLGRVYKALNDTSSALKHFTIAMNLDPKVSGFHLIWFFRYSMLIVHFRQQT
jgi:anaphase-promoting complex subunit 3